MLFEALLCARRFCYTKDAGSSSGRHRAAAFGFWWKTGRAVLSSPASHNTSLSRFPRGGLFREHNALFEGSQSVFSLDFLSSAFLKTRVREGRVLFLWFRETKEQKRVFCSRTTRLQVAFGRGGEKNARARGTRARRVQSLSRNEKDAYFLSLFFLEFATENAADGVNRNKKPREDGSTTNNRRAGKERR